MVERKYNVYMNGEVIDRGVTKAEAERLIDEYLAEDEDNEDGDDNFYSIKPVQ